MTDVVDVVGAGTRDRVAGLAAKGSLDVDTDGLRVSAVTAGRIEPCSLR